MQSASSRIRTRVAVSISYDDNYYTTATSINKNHLLTLVWKTLKWVNNNYNTGNNNIDGKYLKDKPGKKTTKRKKKKKNGKQTNV